jgi:hypothetical protein
MSSAARELGPIVARPERAEHCLIRLLPKHPRSVNRHQREVAFADGSGSAPLLSSWVRRPIRVKVHGKKREHGPDSGDSGLTRG